MNPLERIFEHNRRWAAAKVEENPDYFRSKARIQKPQYLWIGCADSRVMANEITGLDAGELFVHRNIANVVVHTDFSCLSVLQFGIEFLGVRDIIVCGHYGCGGIATSMARSQFGLADNWLEHIRDVYDANKEELEAIADIKRRADRLAELNVICQVRNVSETTVVQKALSDGLKLRIHGVIYSIEDGLLHDLSCSVSG